MSALIIDGKSYAASVESQLQERSAAVKEALGRPPVLAVVLVGDNPASRVYVQSKSRRAKKCGMEAIDIALPADVAQEKLEAELRTLSERGDVDGILLQLPLPKGFDEFSALMAIAPEKDVDGLHPVNQGMLLRGAKAHRPCTPLGCLLLAKHASEQLHGSADLTGQHVVVVGRSILVGKPAAQLFLEENCTVTICHSRTKDLPAECRRADILVAAVGRPQMIKSNFVKPGSIVIDVGINRLDDGRLVGDVDYDDVFAQVAAITPVPGGVGPMTIAMLLSNTVLEAERKILEEK